MRGDDEEAAEVINMQARDLLKSLRAPARKLDQGAPVSESIASLDLKLSLGGSYLPRSMSSSPSTNGLGVVRNNGSAVFSGGASWLPDHSRIGTGPLKRSFSLAFTGAQEPKTLIWNALAKRRIDSTRRFLMQRRARKVSEAAQPATSEDGFPANTPAVRPFGLGRVLQFQRGRSFHPNTNFKDLPPGNAAAAGEDRRMNELKPCQNGFEDNGLDLMKMMPSVVTICDDSGCRVVEGILYKYSAQKVSIVCICHGSFLSPEEFVSHSGKLDTSNPMKHIKVMYDDN